MATEKQLIDADEKFVLNAEDLTGHIMCFENGYATVFDRFAKVICKFSILDAPTVDAVEVVHGRWKPYHEADIGYDEYGVRCSNCGFEVEDHEVKFIMHYCPNCGAKMDLKV